MANATSSAVLQGADTTLADLAAHECRIETIALNSITVLPDRMRRLRPEVVNELVESIAAQGG
jgi:hypothetical protein